MARAAAFGSKVVILDEPTAALGVKETGQVLRLIRDLRERGLRDHPDQPQHAATCSRSRTGSTSSGWAARVGVITPKSHTPAEAVAIMTGAARL